MDAWRMLWASGFFAWGSFILLITSPFVLWVFPICFALFFVFALYLVAWSQVALAVFSPGDRSDEIGRASCRERV